MKRRGLCSLLLVLAALCISAGAIAGRGGGWVHGGGGGGGGWHGGYHGGGWSHGGYYHGGYYHGGYYHGYGWYHGGRYYGWYGCCGSASLGFYFGPGFVYGYPFYPYYYPPYVASVYYPYVSGDFPQPTQWIEQGHVQDQGGTPAVYDPYQQQGEQGGGAPQFGVWYYCVASQTYYPYVQSCPGGWQEVPARPPDS